MRNKHKYKHDNSTNQKYIVPDLLSRGRSRLGKIMAAVSQTAEMLVDENLQNWFLVIQLNITNHHRISETNR